MRLTALILIATPLTPPLWAQTDPDRTDTIPAIPPAAEQISAHMGEMTMAAQASGEIVVSDALHFEPFQQLGEMLDHDDVVHLMRHGPPTGLGSTTRTWHPPTARTSA